MDRDAYRCAVFNRPWMFTAPSIYGIKPNSFGGIYSYLDDIERKYHAGPWR